MASSPTDPTMRNPLLLFVLALVMASPAAAQLRTTKVITLDGAKNIVAAAEAEAKKNGWNMAYAVVDIAGELILFHKGDGVDTITDFVHSGKFHETIDLSDFSGDKLRFKDLDISREGRHDVSVDFGKGSDEIIIQDVTVKQITAADFHF
jgi:hypothetical protein